LVVVEGLTLLEARFHQTEVVPRTHLGYFQGNDGTTTDAMKGHLPSVHRDVLEAIL
jgi:hypothetical protein